MIYWCKVCVFVHLCYYVDNVNHFLFLNKFFRIIVFFSNYIPFSVPSCCPIRFKPFVHLLLIITSCTLFPFLEFPNIFPKKYIFCALLLSGKKYKNIPAVWFSSNFTHNFYLSLRMVFFFSFRLIRTFSDKKMENLCFFFTFFAFAFCYLTVTEFGWNFPRIF